MLLVRWMIHSSLPTDRPVGGVQTAGASGNVDMRDTTGDTINNCRNDELELRVIWFLNASGSVAGINTDLHR
jgi:hypothetical protein